MSWDKPASETQVNRHLSLGRRGVVVEWDDEISDIVKIQLCTDAAKGEQPPQGTGPCQAKIS